MSNQSETLVTELDQLLEAERRALIAGDFEELTHLHDRKTELVNDLNGSEPGENQDIAEIRKKMARNQNLLGGALDGIRSVADRMAELRRIRQSLSTYDREGRRHEINTTTAQQLERRA